MSRPGEAALIMLETAEKLRTEAVPTEGTDVVRDAAGLAGLKAEWDGLHDRSAQRNPFLCHEWADACWRNVCGDARPFIVTARRGGRLVGVAPMRLERHLGMRVLRFIGKGLSPYTGFLTDADEAGIEEMLLEGLARAGREWDLLILTQLADDFTRLHQVPLPRGLGGQVSSTAWKGASYLARDVDWETLRAEGPQWLGFMEKKVRKFERSGGAVERLAGAEAAARIEQIEAIEANSWQGRYGHSQSAETRKEIMGLLQAALGYLGERGQMELWLATLNGEPIAYEINMLLPGRLWLYRGAYHEEHRKLSAGSILDYLSVREAWREGRREFDYMSGAEPYKSERTDAVRPLHQLCLFPRTARGRAAYLALFRSRELLERFEPTRAALLQFRRILKSPASLLPGKNVVRSRIH